MSESRAAAHQPDQTLGLPPAIGSRVPYHGSIPWVVVLLFSAVVLRAYDVSWAHFAIYASYIAGVIVVPGTLVWRWLRPFPSLSRLEDLVMGAILGYVVEIPAYCLARWLGHPRWYALAPFLIIVAALAARNRSELWWPDRPRLDRGVAWSLAAICCYTSVWIGHKLFAITAMTDQNMRAMYEDEPLQLSYVGELTHHFPPVVPFVSDQPLSYHWFSYAHIAASSWVTGIDGLELLRRFDPVMLSLWVVVGTAVLTIRVTRRAWPGVVAAGLLTLVGAFDLSGVVHGEAPFDDRFLDGVILYSPTQMFGLTLSIGVTMALLHLLSSSQTSWRNTLSLALLLFALSGSKATFLPIFVAGIAAVCTVQVLTRDRSLRSTAAALAIAMVALAFAQLVLFRGASRGMGVIPMQTAAELTRALGFDGTAMNRSFVLAMLVGQWLLPGLGAVVLLRRGRWRDPSAQFLIMAVAAGITATFTFAQGGLAQRYFGRSVSVFVVVLSAWGLSVLLPNPVPRRQVLRLIAAAGTSGAVVWGIRQWTELQVEHQHWAHPTRALFANPIALAILAATLFALRIPGRLQRRDGRVSAALVIAIFLGLGLSRSFSLLEDVATGDSATEKFPTSIAAGGIQAATWLRDNSDPDDVVATNAHCRFADREPCDNRKFWMSAFSERHFVVEGWGYTEWSNTQVPVGANITYTPYYDPSRLAVNDTAFLRPSSSATQLLASMAGVTWLFVDKTYPIDFVGLQTVRELTLVYDTENFAIFEVRPGGD